MRRLLILITAALLWGAAGLAVIGITAMTNTLWNAEVGYLLIAAIVAGAWAATEILLLRGRLRCPYRPTLPFSS